MAGTFTKEIILKNQRAIVRDFGGVRNFEETINYLKSSRRTGTWNAIYDAYETQGYGAVYYSKMYDYLKRTIPDFNKESYFYKKTGEMKTDRVVQVYCGMMATAGTRLYDSLKEGKNPLAKKKTVKKRAVKRK